MITRKLPINLDCVKSALSNNVTPETLPAF